MECTVRENNAVRVRIRPSDSCILVRGKEETAETPLWVVQTENTLALETFKVSACRSIDYPKFEEKGEITLPNGFETVDSDFSGFIAYETGFTSDACSRAVLEISSAKEAVEVFVNGENAGMSLLPPFAFDITKFVKPGENTLRIEVATTLERENLKNPQAWTAPPVPPAPTGITGSVQLRYTLK